MTDLLILRVGEDPSAPVSWAACEGAAVVEIGARASLSEIAALEGRFGGPVEVALVIPGAQVVSRTLPAAPKSAAKLQNAARLLLEDEIAEPIDDVHVATSMRGDAARIAAIARWRLDHWLAACRELTIRPSAVFADCDTIIEASPSILIEPASVAIAVGGKATSVDRQLADYFVEPLFADTGGSEIAVFGRATELPTLLNLPHRLAGEGGDPMFFDLALKALRSGNAVNLLQGAYRPARGASINAAKWRGPAMAAAVSAVAFLLFFGVDAMRLSREARHYETEAKRIHAEAFPDAATVDPRRHAQAVLATGGDISFSRLSRMLSDTLTDNTSVEIDRIRFDAQRRQFAFTVRSASDSEIEAFRKALEARGLSASDNGGYRRSGAFWSGEMTASL